MIRECIFRDGNELIKLPVTPYKLENKDGVKMQALNLTTLGDINISGNKILDTFTLESFFPHKDYYFAKAKYAPSYYFKWFSQRAKWHKVIRYIVTGLDINVPVKVESIEKIEKDGTNDWYYILTLREEREGLVSQPLYTGENTQDLLNTFATSNPRSDEALASQSEVVNYTVKNGDCLWLICRSHYGNANLWNRLQKYNGLSSTVIFTNQVLLLPPVSVLEGY